MKLALNILCFGWPLALYGQCFMYYGSFTLSICFCVCHVIFLALFSVVLFTLSDGKCQQTSKQINTNANAQCERALIHSSIFMTINFEHGHWPVFHAFMTILFKATVYHYMCDFMVKTFLVKVHIYLSPKASPTVIEILQ